MLSESAKARALHRGPGFWGFFLAHHFAGDLEHCYQIWLMNRPLWICSRCLGLYPVLITVLIIQFVFSVPPGWYDIPWLFVGPVPALVDWGLSRFGLRDGSNLVRTMTATLLGASLGRTIYLNFFDPGGQLVLSQLACFIVIVGGVELTVRLRMSHGLVINGTIGSEEKDAEAPGFE